MKTLAALGAMVAVFLLAYLLPFEALPATGKLMTSGREALLMLQDYAQHHVMLCLVPALFIAGATVLEAAALGLLAWAGLATTRKQKRL